eukprot:3794351-Amphidinium_carterae.2
MLRSIEPNHPMQIDRSLERLHFVVSQFPANSFVLTAISTKKLEQATFRLHVGMMRITQHNHCMSLQDVQDTNKSVGNDYCKNGCSQ